MCYDIFVSCNECPEMLSICKSTRLQRCSVLSLPAYRRKQVQCLNIGSKSYNPKSWAVTASLRLVCMQQIIRTMGCISSLLMLLSDLPTTLGIICMLDQTNIQLTTAYVNMTIYIIKHATQCLCNTVKPHCNEANFKFLSVISACSDYLLPENVLAITNIFL